MKSNVKASSELTRKQRKAIDKIATILDNKILPLVAALDLPNFTIYKECCAIHEVEVTIQVVEKQTFKGQSGHINGLH